MIWIKMLETATRGRDVNLPESVKHRSVEGGALILVPGQSMEVTREEWDHIQADHADILPTIVVLRDEERAPAVEPQRESKPAEPVAAVGDRPGDGLTGDVLADRDIVEGGWPPRSDG